MSRWEILYESPSWRYAEEARFKEYPFIVCVQAMYLDILPDITKYFDKDQPVVIAFIQDDAPETTRSIWSSFATYFTNIVCMSVPNRGMDILPFYIELEYLERKRCGPEWIMKIHTKRDDVFRWISTQWVQEIVSSRPRFPSEAGMVGPSVLYFEYDRFHDHAWLFSPCRVGFSDTISFSGSGFFAMTQFLMHKTVAHRFCAFLKKTPLHFFSPGRLYTNDQFEHFCERVFGCMTLQENRTCVLLPIVPHIIDTDGQPNNPIIVSTPPLHTLSRIIILHVLMFASDDPLDIRESIVHEWVRFHFTRHAFDRVIVLVQSDTITTGVLSTTHRLYQMMMNVDAGIRKNMSIHVEILNQPGQMTFLKHTLLHTSKTSVCISLQSTDWPWMLWVDRPVQNGRMPLLRPRVMSDGRLRSDTSVYPTAEAQVMNT